MTPDEVAQWLEASCRAQGVPLVVTDDDALKKVRSLLVPSVAAARAHGGAEHARTGTDG